MLLLRSDVFSTTCALCPQVKFNQALADHSMSDKPRLIDGIVLTKFDTIDDKVFLLSLSLLRSMEGVVLRHPPSLAGRRCHLHDLHHGPADRVRGDGADLQRPAQPQRARRGQRSDEGVNGCMSCCLSIVTLTALSRDVPARPPVSHTQDFIRVKH